MSRKIKLTSWKIYFCLLIPLLLHLFFLLIPLSLPLGIKLPLIILDQYFFESYFALFFLIYRIIPEDWLLEAPSLIALQFPNFFAIFLFFLLLYLLFVFSSFLKKKFNQGKNPRKEFFKSLILFFIVLAAFKIVLSFSYVSYCQRKITDSGKKGDVLYFHFERYLNNREEKSSFMKLLGMKTFFYTQESNPDNVYLYPYKEEKLGLFCLLEFLDLSESFRPLSVWQSLGTKEKYSLENWKTVD